MNKPLIVLSVDMHLIEVQLDALRKALEPVAENIGAGTAVLGRGMSIEVHRDLGPVVDAINANTRVVETLVRSIRPAVLQALAVVDLPGDPRHDTAFSRAARQSTAAIQGGATPKASEAQARGENDAPRAA